MRLPIALIFGLFAGCAKPQPTPPAAPAAAPPATPSAACATPEHRQLDFWLGEWDVTIRTRAAPDKDEWAEAKGTQRIEAILGGCAISEHFTAEGPQTPWAGRSFSSWQAKRGEWRQTWVDDQGGYLAFTGGVEGGVFTLYGEPRVAGDQTIEMRMVFLDVTPTSLRWEWQRTVDGRATWLPMMIIDYRRR